jgi:hypothetical protein
VRLARLTPTCALAWLTLAAAACFGHSSAGGTPNPLEPGVLRPNQAPIVGLLDVLTADTLVGKRVRVLGWCVYAPGLLAGRRTGAWFLGTPDTVVEVRGLVPPACAPSVVRQALVMVFAQVVPAEPGSGERLLLRLPE